ncbi:MAG: outer membrane beta-barrel protein [Alphaproteobacteria bacterium GM202ARS2]|nr:outer membrane beta-barrel protein [Alphaproteobacteria bacterium GM202ARS2]
MNKHICCVLFMSLAFVATVATDTRPSHAQSLGRSYTALLGGGVFSNIGDINVNGSAAHFSYGYDLFFPHRSVNPFFFGFDTSVGYIFSEEDIEEQRDGIQYTTDFSLLGRFGYQGGNTAIYSQFGYGWSILKVRSDEGRTTLSLPDTITNSTSINGPRFGAGIDYVVFETYALRFDYLYVSYGKKAARAVSRTIPIGGHAHFLRFGLTRYF